MLSFVSMLAVLLSDDLSVILEELCSVSVARHRWMWMFTSAGICSDERINSPTNCMMLLFSASIHQLLFCDKVFNVVRTDGLLLKLFCFFLNLCSFHLQQKTAHTSNESRSV